MATQRARRYTETYDVNAPGLEEHEILLQQIGLNRQKALSTKRPIDTRGFTPGTEIMKQIKQVLVDIVKYLQNGKYYDVEMYVSSSDREGEGEYKIFEHIKKGLRHSQQRKKVLVIGSDSDLILFGLQAASYCDLHILKTSDDQLLFDCTEMRRELLKKIFCPTPIHSGKLYSSNFWSYRHSERMIDDFCFLSLLNGNDYVPRLRGYNYLFSWNEYCQIKSNEPDLFLTEFSFSDNGYHLKLNLAFLKQLLKNEFLQKVKSLAYNPKSFLIYLIGRLYRNHVIEYVDAISSQGCKITIILKKNNSSHIIGKGVGITKTMAKEKAVIDALDGGELFSLVHSDYKLSRKGYDNLKQLLLKEYNKKNEIMPTQRTNKELVPYFEGMLWTIQYLKANCINFSFQFNHRAISIDDVKNMPNDYIEISQQKTNYMEDEALQPHEFMMSILPWSCKDLIPAELQQLMERGSPLEDLYHGSLEEIQQRWKDPNAIERMKIAIGKRVRETKLEAMPLQPTIKFTQKSIHVEQKKPHQVYRRTTYQEAGLLSGLPQKRNYHILKTLSKLFK